MAPDNTIPASMPGTSASKSKSKRSFLGSLAREIRDVIYDLLMSEEEEVDGGAFFKMCLTVPHVRLVSKQVRSEYDERCPVDNQLQVFRRHVDNRRIYGGVGRVPPRAIRTTHLRIHFIWCKDCEEEPARAQLCQSQNRFAAIDAMAAMWAHYIAQILCYRHDLPHLKEHEVIISCSSLACALALQTLDAAKYLLDQPEFMPPRVSLLRPICDKEDRRESMSSNVEESAVERPRTDAFFEGRETMATWSCKGGWQADEEVVEKCRKEEAEWLSSRLQEG
jgi:hypothetical protein